MFSIGDQVAYPMHGAGTIENIEEKQILGEIRQYYLVRILCGNMQVMVPVAGSESVGLRKISEEPVIERVLEALGGECTPMDGNWNRRNRDNMEKLKTGDPFLVAEVVRNLVRADRVKKLSTGEKKLLGSAKQILSSEMVLVRGISLEEALELIDNAI